MSGGGIEGAGVGDSGISDFLVDNLGISSADEVDTSSGSGSGTAKLDFSAAGNSQYLLFFPLL
jgi:hypothetical protein